MLQGRFGVLLKLQKHIFALSFVCIILFFLLHYLGYVKESLISIYLFLSIWGLEKCLSWRLGYKIGVAPMITRPANANSQIRLLGLIWGVVISAFGAYNLFSVLAT